MIKIIKILTLLSLLFALAGISYATDDGTLTMTHPATASESTNSSKYNISCSFAVANFSNITAVTFSLNNGTLISNTTILTANQSVFNGTWDTSRLTDGSFTIQCIGYDNQTFVSNTDSATMIVDDTAPVILSYTPTKAAGSKVEITITTQGSDAVCKYYEEKNVNFSSMKPLGSADSQNKVKKILSWIKTGPHDNVWFMACRDAYHNVGANRKITVQRLISTPEKAAVAAVDETQIRVTTTTASRNKMIIVGLLIAGAIVALYFMTRKK